MERSVEHNAPSPLRMIAETILNVRLHVRRTRRFDVTKRSPTKKEEEEEKTRIIMSCCLAVRQRRTESRDKYTWSLCRTHRLNWESFSNSPSKCQKDSLSRHRLTWMEHMRHMRNAHHRRAHKRTTYTSNCLLLGNIYERKSDGNSCSKKIDVFNSATAPWMRDWRRKFRMVSSTSTISIYSPHSGTLAFQFLINSYCRII